MAIALLEADGRIALDDDVRKYIPELHDFGKTITLRHLVHHTSGIRDWPGTMSIGGWSYEDVMSFSQILRMAYNQRELNFTPGDVHAYSNTGYNLLAEVVARASGKSFRQFCEDRIFKPLGMTKTHFHDDHTEIVLNRAESYRFAGGQYRHFPSNLTAVGSSSLFTTIEDLAKWIENLHAAAPAVGGKAVVTRLHERGRLNSGESVVYAFGQTVNQYRGLQVVSHTGSWAGYRSILQRFPEQQFAVVILANASNMNPSLIAREIADLYLADRFKPAPPAPPTTPMPVLAQSWKPGAEELQAYTGEYYSAELQTSYVLEARNGELIARHFRTGEFRLRPLQPDVFQAPSFGNVTFVRDTAGRIQALTMYNERVRNLRFNRITR
jgi:CubicO group peptidase (beta-lactamase class C family)